MSEKIEVIFLTNPENYYFQINDDVALNKEVLVANGCLIHKTADEMYNHVQQALNLDRDEVEGGDICIILSEGVIKESQHARYSEIELNDGQTLEDYITNYIN